MDILTKDEQKLAKSALGIEKNGMPCYLYNMTKAEREKYIRKYNNPVNKIIRFLKG